LKQEREQREFDVEAAGQVQGLLRRRLINEAE